ncbi:GGDEF domain-containing protein [Agreia pratensis]|uniref:GGDEF domain-containing protein n=1 Tax=Agreia pratensis TaxID=150121 RepID=UPI00188BFFF0|nr:GGDEF domain-containing protein [Agreia pratensis]MBF4634908.1 GGDEF domain-containing protein [Agreia pratensis]
MNLDIVTLMTMSSLAVVICGVSFVLNTSFARSDPTGRMWSLGFISGIIVAAGYGVEAAVPDAWWGLVVGNVAYIGAVGGLWCGTRLHNGRRPLLGIVVAVAAVVALATIVQTPGDGTWAGAPVLWLGLAALSFLGGLEFQRGRLHRNVNGRSLGIVLFLFAFFSAARVIAFFVGGPDGAAFALYFNPGVAAMFTMAVIISAAITVSVLRAERGGDSAVGDHRVGILSRAGVLSADSFEQTARDHLERAEARGAGMALIGADIDRLPDVNTAFGRSAGDEAISTFAQTLRDTVPVMAAVGHPSAGRFFVLVLVANATEALVFAEQIQIALVDTPLPATQKIRLTASLGIADTFDHGYALQALETATIRSIDTAKAAGGNRIEVSAVELG